MTVDLREGIIFISKREDDDMWYYRAVKLKSIHRAYERNSTEEAESPSRTTTVNYVVFTISGLYRTTHHRTRDPDMPDLAELRARRDSVFEVFDSVYSPGCDFYNATFRCSRSLNFIPPTA